MARIQPRSDEERRDSLELHVGAFGPAGALIAFGMARRVELAPLVMFGAGTNLYSAASDLIPTIQRDEGGRAAPLLFGLVLLGLGLTLALAFAFRGAGG